jgi:hypothetical protein
MLSVEENVLSRSNELCRWRDMICRGVQLKVCEGASVELFMEPLPDRVAVPIFNRRLEPIFLKWQISSHAEMGLFDGIPTTKSASFWGW